MEPSKFLMRGFLAFYCLCLACNLGRLVWYGLELEVRQYELKVVIHDAILRNESYLPIQYHSYPFALVAEAMHQNFGVSLRAAYTAIFTVGYLSVLAGCWFWYSQMCFNLMACTLGITAIAAYVGPLMWSVAIYHPSDPYGSALFALALGAAAARRFGWCLVISVVAGFIWRKHVVVGPVLFCYLAAQHRWRSAFFIGIMATGLVWVGQWFYQVKLGPHDMIPGGSLPLNEWLRSMPKSFVAQATFAGPPLAIALIRWASLPTILKAALVAYPTILLLYAAQTLFWYEMRSFWIAVPVFGALIASISLPNGQRTTDLMARDRAISGN